MQSKATTVEEYISGLPEDRRTAIEAVRAVIRKNLDSNYEEGMQYGMIGYYVPHRVYPQGYHCDPKQPLPFGGLASQKNHMSVYLMCMYDESDLLGWFRKAWAATGKKLDMGKCCIRFKKLDDLALDLIGEAVRRVPASAYVSFYESVFRNRTSRASGAAKVTKMKARTGTTAARKVAPKAAKKASTKSSAKSTKRPTKKSSRK